MSKKEVECTVLGHADGPPCQVCSKPMDTIRVEKSVQFRGKKTAYCYHCMKNSK